MKNITIKQLRAFVALAREASFTRAASRLNISQSALTITIRQIEEEVGLKLFDRTTRSVHLTSHAHAFLPVAERILQDLSRSLDELTALAERKRGNVVAAASASFLCYVLAPTVTQLQKRFPGIRVKLLNTPDSLARRVLEEEIDFGVTNILQAPHGLESYPLLDDTFGVICPAEHPLAQEKDTLTWSHLADYPLVTMPSGTQTHEIINRENTITSILPPPVCEANSIFALGAMIDCGIGIAPVPAHVAKAIINERVVYRPLENPVVKRNLYIIKRQGRSVSPAARELLSIMISELLTQQDSTINIRIRHNDILGNF